MADAPAQGYLRFPSISGGVVAFVTEDDLWAVPAEGGQARRLTADLLGIAHPVVSPDEGSIAFTSESQGQTDVYVLPTAGGMARRLTWLGNPGRPGLPTGGATKVLAWTASGEVVFASDAGQPFSVLTPAYTIGTDGTQPPRPLPYGPLRDLSYGPGGAVVIGRNTADPAIWKRYRGGTAGNIWIDRHGTGEFEVLLRPEALGGNLASPMWVGERIYFLSDHQGVGNLYSCDLDGRDLRRHTDHAEHYARLAKSDGRRIVYQVAARLWIYDPATDEPREIAVELGSPRTQRQPHFVPADRHLEHYALDKAGERLALHSRGKLYTLAPFDRPVTQHGVAQGARYRLASFLGESSDLLVVSDARGSEAVEVHRLSSDAPSVDVLQIAGLGRVVELSPSPDGSWAAIANHKNQLLLVPVLAGEGRLLDESASGKASGLCWSPDSKWLAYSLPASDHTSQIKLANAATGETFALTPAEFRDFCPTWSPDGKYLYFLSARIFDPAYDSIFFDLGFPFAVKPYLVTLQANEPSPFLVRPAPPRTDGHKPNAGTPDAGERAASIQAPHEDGDSGERAAPEQSGPADAALGAGGALKVDLDGIAERAVAVPVPPARYEKIVALASKLLMLSRPLEGSLARHWPEPSAPDNATLEVYDLVEDRKETLLSGVADFVVSGDHERLAYTTSSEGGWQGRRLRIVAASAKADPDAAKEPPGRRSGFVDLSRVRVEVSPPAEWAQMLREAWRLQPEHFWAEDLSGVDWQKVLERYLPLVDLVGTRSELSDLIWEMQGELGTSHSYEIGGEYKPAPPWGQAHLGADLRPDSAGHWVVERIVTGPSWDDKEASPLSTPGAQIVPGATVLAVNGQPVDPAAGPAPLLANQAGLPVELTVAGPADKGPRRVVVPTLRSERPLRYRAWVEANRQKVRQATGGRAGYVHIPDMMPAGWAEFHRSYLSEMERDALLVDARFNAGGEVSGLILEKLARRRVGWAVPRWGQPAPYPAESPLGPLVLLTNEWAGSDGDIFAHAWKMLRLGPVVGMRTWGGVIGIELNHVLVDGTITTQPEYAFWFDDAGWSIENRGAEPDEEVPVRPQDYAAGRDTQLERALELLVQALSGFESVHADLGARPRKPLPVLPAGQ